MMVVPVGRAWASLAMGIAAGANTIKTACALRRAAARVSDARDRIYAWSSGESIGNLGMIVPFAWFPKIRL